MIGARRRMGGQGSDNSWPGFVDALSSLLLVIIFLLSMFVLAQFFLGKVLSGREEALVELRSKVAELGDLLKVERSANTELRGNIATLSSSLNAANADRDTLEESLMTTRNALTLSQERVTELAENEADISKQLSALIIKDKVISQALSEEQILSERARAEVAMLEQSVSALRAQLSRLESALQVSEDKDRRNQAVIVDMGKRLNRALASKVEELAGYRSEFFGRLKEVLSERPEIRIEGDRFVFASELLFGSASAELGPVGRAEMGKFAETLLEISRAIPTDVQWILRVDGHTDKLPISNAKFRNNWELSAARAISVVEFLIASGVDAKHLAATGFGEYQPLDQGENSIAYAKNRRIEMRLTQR